MRASSLLPSLPLLLLLLPKAEANYKKITVEELCAYDSYCGGALNGDNTVKRPNKVLLKLLEENRANILDSAHRLGVDPRAVAGSILAENTMNVGVEDAVQDWFAKQGITSVFGKSFSFGLGQIHVDTAMSAEKFMAAKEQRPERDNSEVAKRLSTPEGSIEYAAGILLEAQEEYKKVGIDISDRPELLCTIYNLGQPKNRAENSKKSGKEPKPNYFGFFVGENLPLVEKILETKNKGDLDILATAQAKKQLKTVEPVELFGGVPTCKDSNISGSQGGKYYEYMKKSREVSYPLVGKLEGEYEIISRNIDCDAEDWILIRAKSGAMGWVKKDKLQSVSISSPWAASICQIADKACAEKINKLYSNQIPDSQHSYLSFKISTPKDFPAGKTVSWKSDLQSCLGWSNMGAKANGNLAVGGSSTQMNTPAPPGQSPISKKEAIAFLPRIDRLKRKLARNLEIPIWEDPSNPLQNVFHFEGNLRWACANLPSGCSVKNKADLEKALDFDVSSLKTWDDLQKFRSLLASIYVQTPSGGFSYNPYALTGTPGELAEKINESCGYYSRSSDIGIKSKFESILDELKKLDQTQSIQLNNGQSLLQKACGNSTTLLRALETNDADIDLDEACDLAISYHQDETSLRILLRLGVDYNQDILGTEIGSQLDQLLSSVRSANPATAMDGQPEIQACAYDPEKTLDRVMALAADDCVESVLVADPYLFNSASPSFRKKIILSNFETDDRFAVFTKTNCEEKK